MKPSESGRCTVLDGGTVLPTDFPLEVAHEFVHTGCLLCEAGEDHASYSALRGPASTVASISQAPQIRSLAGAKRTLRDSP